MIKSLRFVFLALFVALQFVAYGQPAERLIQVQVTPDHTNWLYKLGESETASRCRQESLPQ